MEMNTTRAKHDDSQAHHHGLSPFQKLLCTAELLGMGYLILFCFKTIVGHITHVVHLLQH